MERSRKPHAIVIPMPHQGHINPSIDIALKLAMKGIVVTFVNLEFVHHQMRSKSDNGPTDLFHDARKLGLDIHHRTIGDGFPLEFDRVVHLGEFWQAMIRDFPARVDELIREIIQSDPHLAHFLVADALFTWPATVAKKHRLIYVSVWTEPATVFTLNYHSQLLREKGHLPCKDNVVEEINYIPGIKSMSTKDLMLYMKDVVGQNASLQLAVAAFEEVKNADFILHNTVFELDHDALSAINKYQPNYAIGPISFSRDLPTNIVCKSIPMETDCTDWLASKPPGSVVYVSFGSLVQISKQEIKEIAYGLVLSEVKFIWVVRVGIAGEEQAGVLPDGFEDGIKDKGMIIPWCNQIGILSDPAVGGFLTHCGWNSVLESMWCGVPMICYPIEYDQPTNRKLVVYDWKIGVSLCDGVSPNKKEVAEKIKSVVGGSASKHLNQNMKNIREKVRSAVETDGSLETDFNQFVTDLKAKIDGCDI